MKKNALLISLFMVAAMMLCPQETWAQWTGNGKINQCLTLVANENNCELELEVEHEDDDNDYRIKLVYSTDGTTWQKYKLGKTITLDKAGDAVMFKAGGKGTNEYFSCANGSEQTYRFYMDGSISARGNVMSLLDATMQRTDVPYGAFSELFEDCCELTSAPDLPATTLGEYC